MALDLDALRRLSLRATQTITRRDTILYALSVGVGSDPMDEAQLPYVYEEGLRALPTMAITLTYPPLLAAYAAAGVVPGRVLHGEQRFRLKQPLPVEGSLDGETRVIGLVDKGPGRGLLVYNQTRIQDAASGRHVATLTSSSFFLDEGGCGLPHQEPALVRRAVPGREPDLVCALPTRPDAALLYRLSGDWNPLHVLPSLARASGYARPILHGRCSFGIAGHAVLRAVCGWDASRLRGMTARFTSPVIPGETLRTEIWHADGGVHFRTRVVERDVVALDNGFAELDG